MQRGVAIAGAGWAEGNHHLAGGGGRLCPVACGADEVEVGSDREGEIDRLVDAEDDGLAGAGRTHIGVGEAEVGTQLAHDVVLRVGQVDVSTGVRGDTEGLVEGNQRGSLSLLREVVRAGGTAGETCDEGERVGAGVEADHMVVTRLRLRDKQRAVGRECQPVGIVEGRGQTSGVVVVALPNRGCLGCHSDDLAHAVVVRIGDEEVPVLVEGKARRPGELNRVRDSRAHRGGGIDRRIARNVADGGRRVGGQMAHHLVCRVARQRVGNGDVEVGVAVHRQSVRRRRVRVGVDDRAGSGHRGEGWAGEAVDCAAGQAAHAVVLAVRDVERVVAVDGKTGGRQQSLARVRCRAGRRIAGIRASAHAQSGHRGYLAIGSHLAHAVVLLVGYIQVAKRVDDDIERHVQGGGRGNPRIAVEDAWNGSGSGEARGCIQDGCELAARAQWGQTDECCEEQDEGPMEDRSKITQTWGVHWGKTPGSRETDRQSDCICTGHSSQDCDVGNPSLVLFSTL